jgi:hypothetical protein
MAENQPKKWSRQKNVVETAIEPRRLSYSDRIFDPYDPDHPDPEMRSGGGGIQISDYAEDADRQKYNRNTGHALFDRQNEGTGTGTPSLYSFQRGVRIAAGLLSRRSRNDACVRCGVGKKPRKMKQVEISVPPYFAYACKSNCRDWNTEKNPYGARLRKNM